MALSAAETRDEWRETNTQLDAIFRPLIEIEKDTRATTAEKFLSAEEWLNSSSSRIAELRVNLSNETLPRFEQALRTRMAIFWALDEKRREEIVALNNAPREHVRGRVAGIGR
jgi:hypothetical protein